MMSRFNAYGSPVLAIFLSGCGVTTSATPPLSADNASRDGRTAAVVELFTSQGCSSCPPADRVLAELNQWGVDHQAPVYCLSFHVDYWNQLGWTDPYSSQDYTDRQRAYAAALGERSVYTPQMIVNGKHALVGSERDEAFRLVASELKETLPVIIKLTASGDAPHGAVSVLYEVDDAPAGGVLNVAVVEKDAHNMVPRGENAGRDSVHVNVVRAFKTVDLKAAPKGELKFELPPKIAPDACEVFGYVQDEKLRVQGARRISLGDEASNRVELSEAQWRQRLSAEQFNVTRQEGTERPYTGKLLKEKGHGVFTCVGCGAPLFDSSTKFESGTGWPSFWQARKDGQTTTKEDRSSGTVRTEVICQRCGAHLGHVFDDGPQPTGLRYCMNSAALSFIETKTSENRDP